jgi:membrane fusion protein (multidrug efflux system)
MEIFMKSTNKKMNLMKNIQYLSIAVLITAFACSKPEDKKELLEDLKAQHTALSNQIRDLEKQILAENPEAVLKTKSVVAQQVKSGVFNYTIDTQGGIDAEQNIVLSAKMGGVVTSVLVKEGANVRAGEVIAQIDNTLILRSIEELQGNLDLAKTVFERQKHLWEQKIGTEIQFLTAKNNKESLEKRLATLKEQDELSRIKSAVSGTVDDIMLKVGETTAPGLPAARIVGNKNLKVTASVSEAYIRSISVGNPATVTLVDLGETFESKVSFAGKNINPLSRSFGVEIPVPANVDARPGMSAKIRINFKSIPDAIAVPVNLVQNLNGEKIVYVAEKQNDKWVARKRLVEVGGIYDNHAQIISGIKAGDQVITVGFQGLNDGDSVSL